MPSDLGSGTLFVVLFLAGVGALLFLLTWLEPPHEAAQRPHRFPLALTTDGDRLSTSEAGPSPAADGTIARSGRIGIY